MVFILMAASSLLKSLDNLRERAWSCTELGCPACDPKDPKQVRPIPCSPEIKLHLPGSLPVMLAVHQQPKAICPHLRLSFSRPVTQLCTVSPQSEQTRPPKAMDTVSSSIRFTFLPPAEGMGFAHSLLCTEPCCRAQACESTACYLLHPASSSHVLN